jgi:hypothetical protein
VSQNWLEEDRLALEQQCTLDAMLATASLNAGVSFAESAQKSSQK